MPTSIEVQLRHGAQCLPKITSDDFLSSRGLGNEIAFYIFDYARRPYGCVALSAVVSPLLGDRPGRGGELRQRLSRTLEQPRARAASFTVAGTFHVPSASAVRPWITSTVSKNLTINLGYGTWNVPATLEDRP